MKHTTRYILTGLLLLAPFALIEYLYHTPNPYHLSGKHFLLFYISHSWSVYLSFAALLTTKQAKDQPYQKAETIQQDDLTIKTIIKSLCILSLLLGVARIIQGISNDKPVGFLVALLLFNLIIYGFMRVALKKR